MIFKNTYIYIKTCEHCGLKYFGKSTRKKDFVKNKYKGSGKFWNRHIKKYNSNIKTFIINSFDKKQEQECIDFCLWFSRINNIVKNNEWANLCNENGINGGNIFIHKNEEEMKEIKKKISKSNIKTWKNKSEEEKNEFSKKRSKIHKKIWENRSEEEKKEIIKKKSETWKNKSEEDLKEIIKKKSETWKNKSEKEIKEFSKKMSETWKNRSEEEKKEINKKISDGWKNRSEEKKKEFSEKKSKNWKNRSEEKKKEFSKKKSKNWKNKSEEEKELIRKKQSISHKNIQKIYCGFCDKKYNKGNYINYNHHNGFCLFR